MYIPSAFAETDLTKLHDFIQQNSFGLLVSQVDSLPFATHLPFLLERTTGRTAPWSVIWHGPIRSGGSWVDRLPWRYSPDHTPISRRPGTLASRSFPPGTTPPFTPTGQFRPLKTKALLDIVQQSVQFYEQAMPRPWSFERSSPFMDRLLAQIVGFRIELEKIEGKWKLNQNHPVERRRKVVRALEERHEKMPRPSPQ